MITQKCVSEKLKMDEAAGLPFFHDENTIYAVCMKEG